MRKTLLSMLALAGFATSGVFTGASAAPIAPVRPAAAIAGALLQPVYYDSDFRAREWRRRQREEERRRHDEWVRRHRFHEQRGGYGRP